MTDTLATFVPFTANQKTVSMVVVESPESLSAAIAELQLGGFERIIALSQLETDRNQYKIIEKETTKDDYDLAAQYGSGQISVHSPATGHTLWITPNYRGALVFVIAKETLEHIEAAGLPLRTVVGLTTRV